MKFVAKIFYSFIIAAFLTGFAVAQEMNRDAGILFNEGNELLRAGNYKGAIEKYDQALAIEKDFRIYYQKGVALKKTGNLDAAKTAFENCINANTDFVGAYNALGGVYFAQGNFSSAIDNFTQVLNKTNKSNIKNKVKKNLSLAYTKMANTQLNNGSVDNALNSLNKAVEYTNYDAAYLSLAKTYSELGQWQKSLQAAQNALKHRSGISKGGPYYYMGIAYKNLENTAKAIEMFSQARTDATYKKPAQYELDLLQ